VDRSVLTGPKSSDQAGYQVIRRVSKEKLLVTQKRALKVKGSGKPSVFGDERRRRKK